MMMEFHRMEQPTLFLKEALQLYFKKPEYKILCGYIAVLPDFEGIEPPAHSQATKHAFEAIKI